MKKFSKILVGLLVVVCIVEGFFLYRAYAIPSTTLQTARKINRIEQIIDKYYKGSVKKSELEDCTYKGLVAGLGDVYSTYYSEDDFKELEQSTSGVYYGVGIYLTQDIKTGIITVVKPVKGSPADGSGLKSLKKQGAKKLIIDLRDNPGGLLTSVVDIAGQILPKGTIVYTEDKNGNKKYYKDTKNEQLDMPLCVLVNGNSASAAEILSGAIKDDKAGTLVGETTFGKGIVQGFFEVGDGSYVKLTYSSYYTPAGHNIHKKGIKPDVEVKDNTKTKADEQLNKALSILQKK